MDGNLSVGELMFETLNNWYLIHSHRFTTFTCYFKEKTTSSTFVTATKSLANGLWFQWSLNRSQASKEYTGNFHRSSMLSLQNRALRNHLSKKKNNKNKNNRLDRAANFKSHRIGRTNTTSFLSWQWTHKMADKRWTHCCTFGCVKRLERESKKWQWRRIYRKAWVRVIWPQ